MENDLPKVLVVSINAWRDNTGINTLINFFQHWNPEKLAQIYTRSTLPDTEICNHFFQISENAVLKSVIRRKLKTGRVVENERYQTKINADDANVIAEQKKYSFFRKHRSSLFELAREVAWKLGKWNTKDLDQFVDDFNADVLFIPIYAYTYMNRLQLHVIQRAKKPVVTYIADDVYSYRSDKGNLLFYVNRYFLRRSIRKVMKYNNKLLVIAPKLQKELGRIFQTNAKLLTKGIDFTTHPFVEHKCHDVIQLVYTGKTNIGRWKSLSMLAQEIEKINSNKQKMFMSIYTNEELTDRVFRSLNIDGASQVMGGVSLEEALQIQKQADIVVFAESLSWKYKDAARLSFSTKLTDYFANAKCIIAIGNKNIAPIEYLKDNKAALVATNRKEISGVLNELQEDKKIIETFAKNAYNCGKNNHSVKKSQETLTNTFLELVK